MVESLVVVAVIATFVPLEELSKKVFWSPNASFIALLTLLELYRLPVVIDQKISLVRRNKGDVKVDSPQNVLGLKASRDNSWNWPIHSSTDQELKYSPGKIKPPIIVSKF